MLKKVLSPNTPRPGGHYSQAIIHNDTVYVSGQLPIDPNTGQKQSGTIEEQVQRALENLDGVLKAAGSCKDNVIRTTVYISDIGLWNRVNETYSKFFGEHKPARTVVPTKDLHYGLIVEIDAIAAII